MHYRTHWRLAFVLAFFFHLVVWLVLMLLIPMVFTMIEPPPQEDPMEWVDIAEAPGDPQEEQQEQQPEPPPPPPPPAEEQVEEEPAVVEAELPEEATTELLKEAENMTDEPKDNTLHSSNNGQQMGQPGKILLAVQPPKGGLSYKGRITVSAHVGKDGTVMSTKIMVSSGNDIYDNFARSLVQSKWKFQPATDTKGEPMESNIMCTLAFNVPVKRQMH